MSPAAPVINSRRLTSISAMGPLIYVTLSDHVQQSIKLITKTWPPLLFYCPVSLQKQTKGRSGGGGGGGGADKGDPLFTHPTESLTRDLCQDLLI